uniref:Genome polyprotein n=1 Tax=Lagomorph hepacivirus TaxID=3138818 RepID=A0AAU6R4N4_9FLAV
MSLVLSSIPQKRNKRKAPRLRPKSFVLPRKGWQPVLLVKGPRRARGRRGRATRDYGSYLGSSRGGRIPIVDPVLGATSELLLPRASLDPSDPRRRSRNLGHVIDGALGLTADVLAHTPLVGPLLGGFSRGVCRFVRGLEDGANWCTGKFGIVFFLICLLTAVTPGDALRRYAPPGTNQTIAITNCCSASDVIYCTDVFCFHSPGCVICTDVCWEIQSAMVSYHPAHNGTDSRLSSHIDTLAAIALACDAINMPELCGVFVLTVEAAFTWFPHRLNLTNSDCYLYTDIIIDPSLIGFAKWLASSYSTVTTMLATLLKVPQALVNLLADVHFGVLASVLWFGIQGSYVKVLLLLLVYVESSVAFRESPTCTPYLSPEPCHAVGWGNFSHHYCFRPEIVIGNGTHPPPTGFGCVLWNMGHRRATNITCCSLRQVEDCQCPTDCSWLDSTNTYERCGTTPFITTIWQPLPDNATHGFWAIGGIIVPAWHTYLFSDYIKDWDWLKLYNGDREFYIAYNKSFASHNKSSLARLPYRPDFYRYYSLKVPPGFYSDHRDLSTGLVSKTADGEYQLIYSASGFVNLHSIATSILICLLLALLGAKWTLLCYILYLQLTYTRAIPPAMWGVLTMCNTTQPEAVVRFLLGYKYRALAASLLCPWPSNLLLAIVSQFDLGFCLHPVVWQVTWPGLLILAACGLFSWAVARTTYSGAYLGSYMLHFFEKVFSRNRKLTLVVVLLMPQLAWEVAHLCAIVYLAAVAISHICYQVLTGSQPQHVMQTLRSLEKFGQTLGKFLQGLLVTIGADHGVWLFKHLGDGYTSLLPYNDPYFPYAVPFSTHVKVAGAIACGDVVGSKPVVATDGDVILCGVGRIPAGFKHLAPVNLLKNADYGYYTVFKSIVTGCSPPSTAGSVFTFTSAMTAWMGFSCNGQTYTALHGSRGRTMATPQGRMGAVYSDKELDLAIYPRIPGSTDLEVCTCGAGRAYLCLRNGTTRLVVRTADEGRWTPVDRIELGLARGSSGAPLLCDLGHVIGMFTAVGKTLGTVVNIKVTPVTTVPVHFPTSELVEIPVTDPPPVPKDNLKILNIVAPTGSGKSTKLPMHYYNAGYRVLVVNPSVATTLAMHDYMTSTYGVTPNILASDTTINRGSKLTYSTYGRVLASGNLDYDVMILDECHSTDATSVLGIGYILQRVLDTKCKLVLLATATPPGASYAPHPQIEELKMPTSGGIPVARDCHLDPNILRRGRHLVFLPTKKQCDEVASALRQAGITSLSYYRGKDIGDIPLDGDVVVVATDALMTGYTGNFDSVWDLCLSVFTEVRVDLDPTFTIHRITQPSNLVTRLQRRGRTGRGKPGKYYYAAPPPGGTTCVPLVSIVQAFDSGSAYFGLTPAEVGMALDTYHNTPGLPAIHAELPSWCHFFSTLGVPSPAFLNRAKAYAEDFEFLTARMYEELYRAGAAPPNESPRWRGLDGKGQSFVMYNLDGPSANVREWIGSEDLRKCFDEELVNAELVFGVGVGLFLLYGVAETCGSFTVRASYSSTLRSPDSLIGSSPSTPWMEVEECSESLLADVYNTACSKVRAWVDAGAPGGQRMAQTMDINMGSFGSIHAFVTSNAHTFLSLCQYFGGLLTLDQNPLVASTMAGAAALMSPMSLGFKVFIALLGGAVASRLASVRASTMFTMTTVAGSVLSTFTTAGFIINLLSGYTAATHAAVVVMKVLGGTMPTTDELTGLLSGLVAPASLLVGGVLGAVAHFLTTDSTNQWTNRLLSMLTRQTTCPGYFEEAKDLRKTVLAWLEASTPWRVLNTIMDWVQREDVVPCGSSLVSAVCCSAMSLLRAMCELIRGILRRAARVPGLPIVACQPGWGGMWAGDGVLHTTCGCGAQQIWTIVGGRPTLSSCPWTCSSRWTHRIPINNTTTGVPRPIISSYKSFVVSAGFYRYLKYEVRGNDLFCVAASSADDELPANSPPLSAAVMVDGVVISPNAGPCETPWTGSVFYRGQPTPLPICVTNPEHSPRCAFEEREKEAIRAQAPPPLGSAGNPIIMQPPPQNWTPKLFNWSMRPKDGGPKTTFVEKTIVATQEKDNPLPSDSESDVTVARFPGSLPSLSTMPSESTGRPYQSSDLDETISSTVSTPGDSDTDGYDSAVESSDTIQVSDNSSELNIQHRAAAALLAKTSLSSGLDKIEMIGNGTVPPSAREETTEFEGKVVATTTPTDAVVSVPAVPQEEKTYEPKRAPIKTKAKVFEVCSTSSWETISEESCSMSYNWLPFKVTAKTTRRVSPVAVLSTNLTKTKQLAYVTRREDLPLRIQKVTKWRDPQFDKTYQKWLDHAAALARNVRAREWSIDEAIEHTDKKSAKSHLSGITGQDLKLKKPHALHAVTTVYNSLLQGLPVEYRTVTIMAKEEVFALTKEKPTRKPPRIIAYPPLETRVVEKMVLGEIAPKVVKAICRKAYGFQYSPQQRVDRLLEMWRKFETPVGFTCDTVCFDSTITEADVANEARLYASAQMAEPTRARIRALHTQLYAGGPMRTQDGQPAGQRNCRASGVFTTSSSNTMTCYLKVCASLDKSGWKKWELLVNGDDCVIIAESMGVERDAIACSAFSQYMKMYGCPQDAVAAPHYSLERLTSCSSNVSVARSILNDPVYYLTRDPTIPFARCIIEGDQFNPTGAWIGFIINHGPALWVQKVLIPNLLNYLLHCDPLPKFLTFDWWGKNWSVPLANLPEILEGLHGKTIWQVKHYTPYEVERTSNALKTLGMAPLRQWRKRARDIRVQCMRRGGVLRKLALRLLWWDHQIPLAPLNPKIVKEWSTFDYYDFWAEPPDIDQDLKAKKWRYILPFLLVSLLTLLF